MTTDTFYAINHITDEEFTVRASNLKEARALAEAIDPNAAVYTRFEYDYEEETIFNSGR